MVRSMMAIAMALFALAIGSAIAPADAESAYPWCAGGRISETGAPSCGFSSYAQCMASFAPSYGVCRENPFYTGPRAGRR